MTGANAPPMLPPMSKNIDLPKTKAALERLALSVARLERAAAGRAETDARLAAELEAARAEHAALRQVVDQVTARLDGAIGRVQTALED